MGLSDIYSNVYVRLKIYAALLSLLTLTPFIRIVFPNSLPWPHTVDIYSRTVNRFDFFSPSLTSIVSLLNKEDLLKHLYLNTFYKLFNLTLSTANVHPI